MIYLGSKVHELITGYGTFGSEVRTADRFGLPTGIKAGGIGLDIPVGKTIVADNNNRQNFLNYRMQAGMIASSLEHQTPEQMYNTDPNNPIQGISTMKALALANAEGQKIYTITQQNIDTILPMIQASSLTKGDIQSAVNAGKTVTVHEREVSVPGWTGTGYIVIDPVTGDGAYLISGGGNGGFALIAAGAILLWTSFAALTAFPTLISIAMPIMWAASLFMIAGANLLAGNKIACFISAQLAITIITKATLFKVANYVALALSMILGVSLSMSAWKLCHCGEGPPYCLDPIVP